MQPAELLFPWLYDFFVRAEQFVLDKQLGLLILGKTNFPSLGKSSIACRSSSRVRVPKDFLLLC